MPNLVTDPNAVQEAYEALKAGFPFPEIRDTQDRAMAKLAESYGNNKTFTIMELPTGVGKSPLSIAAAEFAAEGCESTPGFQPGAYILTSQKSLQAQLMADFSNLGLVELRGKANYTCVGQHKGPPVDCETASSAQGNTCDGCPYRAAKEKFAISPMGVTNYSYLMHESLHAGELGNREYLIADEAHNIEKEVIGLVEIRLTPKRCEEIDCASPPVFVGGEEEKAASWINKHVMPKARRKAAEMRANIDEAKLDQTDPGAQVKKLAAINSLITRLQMFVEDPDRTGSWISWTDDDGNLLIKPLTAAKFAQDYIFSKAKRVVMLSATILDFGATQRNLGIDPANAVRMRAQSEFPVETRPIMYWPSGSMSYKQQAGTMPKVLTRTANLLNKFGDVKGIIHTHSYKINNMIVDHLKSIPGIKHRIITHTNLPGEREQAIMNHFNSEEPTVLVSPSMTEGLDLKGDLSRFNIIVKVPYPFIDPYNRARMERDPAWYQLQTALALMQATGRSNRSADDYAKTVILDSDFGKFLDKNYSILPEWWTAAIKVI